MQRFYDDPDGMTAEEYARYRKYEADRKRGRTAYQIQRDAPEEHEEICEWVTQSQRTNQT